MKNIEFEPFPKIPRLMRECVITEKLDGTNAQVYITEDGRIYFGSRNRWITPENDNYGFARWATENKEELLKLGPGRHFGEWWGCGIQRTYGLAEKRFSLFNVAKWNPTNIPKCVHIVPQIYNGQFSEVTVDDAINSLDKFGSLAAPGFLNPEGVIIYHTASRQLFKRTIRDDNQPKGA